jgi:hypothetical protein
LSPQPHPGVSGVSPEGLKVCDVPTARWGTNSGSQSSASLEQLDRVGRLLGQKSFKVLQLVDCPQTADQAAKLGGSPARLAELAISGKIEVQS